MNHKQRFFFSSVFFTVSGLLLFSTLSRSVGAQSAASWQVKLQIPLTGVAGALTSQMGRRLPSGTRLENWQCGTSNGPAHKHVRHSRQGSKPS
jgi:hypothetical protein